MTPAARRALEAAGRLFYERGIHAVGVDLIAAEAGVTKKTLYDRFGSKEQIVVEYLADRDERWRAFLAPYLDAARPSPAAGGPGRLRRLTRLVGGAQRQGVQHGQRPCRDQRSVPPGVRDHHRRRRSGCSRCSPISVRAAAPGRADRLGRTLMLLHEGALVAHGLGIFPDPIGQARDEARTLLAAAGVRP